MKIYCVCLYVSDSWMRGFSCQIEQKIVASVRRRSGCFKCASKHAVIPLGGLHLRSWTEKSKNKRDIKVFLCIYKLIPKGGFFEAPLAISQLGKSVQKCTLNKMKTINYCTLFCQVLPCPWNLLWFSSFTEFRIFILFSW